MNLSTTIITLLAILLFEQGSAFLFNKLKNKIKSFIKGTRTKTAEFASDSGLEYPGNDPQLRREIQDLWNEYYRCLEEKYQSLGIHRSVTPEAIMVFEGASVRFDCKACVSPPEVNVVEDVKWFFNTIPPNVSTEVEYGEHVLLSPDDKALHMYNLQKENAGQYVCKLGDTVMAPYILEIANDSEPLLKVKPDSALRANHSQPDKILSQYNLKVFTNWEPWSSCSTCNRVGKRERFGFCTVKELSNDTEARAVNSTQPKQENATSVGRGRLVRTAKSDAMNMLTLFKKGIPCRSILLGSEFTSVPEINERNSEVMTAFCKEPCPGDVIFEVVNEKGEVTETANNSAGIYSTLQGIPPISPPVARETIYDSTNTFKVVIRCPGNLNSDRPVTWQLGSKNVNPILLEKQSKGRLYIDEKDRINIKRPQKSDSGVYSCWQSKELAGTVRLVITEVMRLNFNHHVMLFGLVCINGTFLIVCYRVYKGRKRKLAR